MSFTAGRPADETGADFEILKLLYRFNYLEIYCVKYHCNFVTALLELHSIGFCLVKVYFKVCFEVQKIR